MTGGASASGWARTLSKGGRPQDRSATSVGAARRPAGSGGGGRRRNNMPASATATTARAQASSQLRRSEGAGMTAGGSAQSAARSGYATRSRFPAAQPPPHRARRSLLLRPADSDAPLPARGSDAWTDGGDRDAPPAG